MATALETIRSLRRKNSAVETAPAATTAAPKNNSALARIAEMRASGTARPIDEILQEDSRRKKGYRDPDKLNALRNAVFDAHDRAQGYDIPKFSAQHQEQSDPDTAAARKYNQNRTAYDTLAAQPHTPERASRMALLKAEMEQYIQYGGKEKEPEYHERKGAYDSAYAARVAEVRAQAEALKPKDKNGFSKEYEQLMASLRDNDIPEFRAEERVLDDWTSEGSKSARAQLAEDVRLADEQAAIRDTSPKFDFTTGRMEDARTANNARISAVKRGQEEAGRIANKEIKTGRYEHAVTDRILNGLPPAKFGIEAEITGYDLMSGDEKDDFYYYLGTGQRDKAFDYIKSLKGRLEDRLKAKEQGELREFAEERPALGAAAQFFSNFGAPLAVLPQAYGAAKNLIKGDAFYEPAKTSGVLNRDAYSAQALNEGVNARITRGLDDTKPVFLGMTAAELARNGYGLVQSMASSAANIAAFGPASIYVMGAQAAGNTSYEAAERGLSPAQALAIGVGSGVVEALTEKYSVENFLKFFEGGSKMGLKLALKEVGKQMLAEGSEEVAAEVLDTALDMLVAGDMSEFEQYKKQLMAGGMGENEANSAAIKQFFVNNVLSAGLGGAVSGGVFGAFGVGKNNYNVARDNRIAERARAAAATAASAEGNSVTGAGDVAADGATTPARGATPPTEGNGTGEFAPYDDNDGFGTPEFGGYDADTIREWLIEDEVEDAPDIETAARIISTVARGQLQELDDADFDVLESSPDFAEIVAGVDEAVREAAYADNREQIADNRYGEDGGERFGVAASDSGTQGQGAAQGQGAINRAPAGGNVGANGKRELAAVRTQYGESSAEASAAAEIYTRGYMSVPIGKNTSQLPSRLRTAIYRAGNLDAETAKRVSARQTKRENNTGENTSPKTAQTLDRLAEITGVKINVADNLQAPEGASDAVRRSGLNGWYDPATRTINLNSSILDTDAAILTTAMHEVTHDLQQSDAAFHAELSGAVRELMGGRAFNAALNALPAAYRDMSAETREAEVVANYLQEQFGNEQSVSRMMSEKPGVVRRVLDAIRNWIADVRSRLTGTAADRATAAQLQRLEQRIGEMMRGAGENTQGGERSSIAGDAGQFEISLDNALDEIDGNITSSPARLVLLTSTTPKVLREYASARDLPITMRYDAMYLAVRESGKLDGNYHGLGDEGLKNVISALDTPQKMLRQQNGRITVITSVPVTGKNNTIAVVELAPETKTDGAYNLVVSAFGAGQRYIDSLSRKSEELYNKEKMSGNQINGLYAHPEAIGADTLNNDSVPQGADGVNTQNLGGNNPQTETQSDTAKSDDSTKNALTRENIESNLDKLPKYSIAYHGTPYTFSEFLLDHIGEGEGAQAHGWGLYFAADRETSEKYQKMLSGDNKFLVNGKPVELKDAAKRDAYTAAAKGELQGYIDDNVAIANEYAAKGDEQNRNKYLGRAEQGRSLLGKTVIQRNAGNVYTVDIPDEDVMLNENLSLVKQPKEVRTALKRAGITARMVKEALGDYDSGRELYGALSGEDGSALGSMEIAPFVRESSEELSRWLNDIGIKGIVYDGQRDGKSYVVFDDKAIKILSDAEEALGGEVMYSLSDAEATENKRTVAAMQPVAQLTGDEFRAGGKTLATEVAAYYDKLGGSVNNPDIGEISLTRRGAKDSIAHGIGNEKATAFAAVPDVLRKGKIISAEENWKGRGYDSFLIAAPVTIAGKQYFEGVVVKATPSMGTQRFYVHEVYANEGADARSTESPEQPEVRGGTSAPTVNSVLRDLWNVKREISGGANNAPRFSLSESEYAKLDDAIATEPEYAEIRRFMRTTPISFAEGDRGDGSDYGFDSYNDMRKQYFGKLKLVNEGGETPDGIYQELQYAFGKGFFPDDITNPMDKWRRVLDVVDEAWANKEIIDSEERRLKALRAEARNTPNSSEAYNDELVSDRLAQLADLREMGIELDRDSRTNRVMTRQGENYERRIGRLKDNAKRRVSKTRRETKAKEREKYEKRNRRAQIARHAKDLSAKLLRPSDAKHVPEGLRAAVMEFLSAIELDVGTDYKIGKLKKQLEIDGGELVIDPDLQGYIEDVQADSDTSMKDMSAAQLETLWKALRGIEAAVSSANKAFALKRTDTISGVSDRLREDTAYNRKKETTDGVISAKMKQLVKLDMLTPETFFHMLGDAGNEMFRTLRDAQDKTTRIAAQVQKFTEKTLKQYKVDVTALEREKRSVTLGGEKVTMTTAQLMKLYALTRREQALEHIFAGGLLPSSIKEGLKARKRISTVRNITQGELAEALKTLTNEQKAYVRAMQRYQSETLGAYGNEASQEVYGYKKFTEDYYSAIRSDSREIMTSIERATRQTSVKNRGMSKPVVPHAATAVRVDSFFDDFSQSAADMATYAGQLAAEADMMRILNRKFRNPDGGVYDTTKQILDEFFGGKGSDYALKLMTDLAGGIEGAHDGTGALTRMFKSGAVGANLRVVIQQPTALIRAGDMISPKYLLEGALPRKGWEKAKKYAPIAQWKDWGYFDVGTGRSLKSVLFNADSKLEKVRSASMALAGKADAMAWGLLWNAAEMETKAKIKRGKSDLKAGTSAFYEAVAERFTEIIDHTQVVDGILQRSQIMRSGNAVTQMATAFMAEPTKKYNMFVSALSDVRAAHKKGAPAGPALRHAARTMASLIVAGAANAAAQALIDALRDDDKEKKFAQKFAEALFGISDDDETFLEKLGTFISGNLFGELAGISDIPFAKDVFSIMQGYKIKRLDMEVVEDAITSSKSLLKALMGEGKMTVGNALTRTIGALAALAGLPVENVRRDVTASVNTALAAIGNWEMIYRADKLLYDISADANKKRFKDIAYFAWLEGDTEQYRAIVEDMKANGFTDEDIEKGITAGVRRSEDYIAELEKTQSEIEGAIAGDATYRGLPDEQKEKLAKDAETYAKAVTLEKFNRDYAIKDTAWENKARNAPKSGVTVPQYIMYRRIYEELESDRDKNGKLVKGKQDKFIEILRKEKGLTQKQRAFLFTLSSESAKNNPFGGY